jgi:hypothetical protein
MVRITGRSRPDRGTIDKSMADRDYRMSTYDKASSSSSEARLRTRNESRETRAERIVIMPAKVWRWRENL